MLAKTLSAALLALLLAPSPATAVRITLSPLPDGTTGPVGVSAGADGSVWVTSPTECRISGYSPETLFLSVTYLTGACPLFVKAAPDGWAWFTRPNDDIVARAKRSEGVQSWTWPIAGSHPYGVTFGADGNVWVTLYGNSMIGKLRVWGADVFASYESASKPAGIALANDGSLWFTRSTGSSLGCRDPEGLTDNVSLPTANALPWGITAGPGNTVFFTEMGVNKIGKYDTVFEVVDEYPIPTPGSSPYGIALGADGNVWFTEETAHKIGRMSPTGEFREWSLPAGSKPMGITAGVKNDLWFVTNGTGQLGHIELAVPGDINSDGTINVADVFWLINFLFAEGDPPQP